MKNRCFIILTGFLMISLTGCAATLKTTNPVQKDHRDQYILDTADSGANWQAIRYIAKTGDAWILFGNEWKKIADSIKVPESRYTVKLVATSSMNWQAIRMDTISGKSWMVNEFKWVEIK